MTRKFLTMHEKYEIYLLNTYIIIKPACFLSAIFYNTNA